MTLILNMINNNSNISIIRKTSILDAVDVGVCGFESCIRQKLLTCSFDDLIINIINCKIISC